MKIDGAASQLVYKQFGHGTNSKAARDLEYLLLILVLGVREGHKIRLISRDQQDLTPFRRAANLTHLSRVQICNQKTILGAYFSQ